MKNKNKILILMLSLVLICSMLFGLVACNNNDGNENENNALEPTTFATFTFKDDMSAKGQTIKINTDPSVIRDDFTLADLLKQDTETKYGFKANLSQESWGTSLNGFTGSKIDDLIPNTFEYIAQYSTCASNGMAGAQPITLDGKQYYMSAKGIDEIKLTTGVDYLFVVDTYISTNKVYETSINKDVYMETSDIVEHNNNIFIIKCVKDYPTNAEKPTLLKIDKTGKIVASKVLSGSNTYAMPKPLIANNNIICATPGSIEAFNIDTLEKVWECKEEVVGSFGFPTYYQMELDTQTGIVYVGLYSGDMTTAGKIIALDSRNGEKSIFTPVDGGAYYFGQSEIVGNYLVTTGVNKEGKYTIMSINKNTGYKVDEKLVNEVVSEDIKNGFIENKIEYKEKDKSLYYTVSERQEDNKSIRVNSYVVRTWFDAVEGKFKSSKDLKLKGVKSNGEIAFNDDRMYITSGNGAYKNTNGVIQVISCATMKEVYSADIPAQCEGKLLVKKLNDKETLVAFTVNTDEDGSKIKYIVDTPKSTKAYVKTLYTPTLPAGYSMSSLLIGEDGTLYYTYQANIIAFKVQGVA